MMNVTDWWCYDGDMNTERERWKNNDCLGYISYLLFNIKMRINTGKNKARMHNIYRLRLHGCCFFIFTYWVTGIIFFHLIRFFPFSKNIATTTTTNERKKSIVPLSLLHSVFSGTVSLRYVECVSHCGEANDSINSRNASRYYYISFSIRIFRICNVYPNR